MIALAEIARQMSCKAMAFTTYFLIALFTLYIVTIAAVVYIYKLAVVLTGRIAALACGDRLGIVAAVLDHHFELIGKQAAALRDRIGVHNGLDLERNTVTYFKTVDLLLSGIRAYFYYLCLAVLQQRNIIFQNTLAAARF